MQFKSQLFFSTFLLFSSCSIPTMILAAEDKPPQIPEFPIFAETSKTSQIVEKGHLNTPLVKIFREKDWVKVADTSNGAVGWVHEEDYKKAVEAWSQPKTESALIQITENQTPKKVEIIAYKNGKKLDEKEAQALYDHFKKQQEERNKTMRQWFNSMNELFNKLHNEAFTGSSFLYSLPVITPIIVVEKPAEESKK